MPCHPVPFYAGMQEPPSGKALLMASSSAVGNYFMLAAKNKARHISSDFAFKLAASRLSATLRKGWQGIGSRWTGMAQLSWRASDHFLSAAAVRPTVRWGPTAAYRIPKWSNKENCREPCGSGTCHISNPDWQTRQTHDPRVSRRRLEGVALWAVVDRSIANKVNCGWRVDDR
jgi:hypothetical protein